MSATSLQCPPILFIIFKRPQTTQEVMAAIRQAQPSKLYIAADGPRPDRQGEAAACEAARKVALQIDWPCQVFTLFRDGNLGCKQGVSSAIDWFFAHEPEGIILEDDVVPVQSFFPFCAQLLELYRQDTRIGMIVGANFQNGTRRGDASYYFSRLCHVWGWASWRRAWQHYDREMRSWPSFKQAGGFDRLGLETAFKAHYTAPFDAVAAGKIDTWDYQWGFTCLSQNMLSVIPQHNMIKNVGFGADATHTFNTESSHSRMNTNEIAFPLIHPTFCIADPAADLATIRGERISLPRKLLSSIARRLS